MDKINKLITIPENREGRIERLNEAVSVLKSEFIGLDDIIDEIRESISSWYITPEIINRPTIISLWGMTGTGKSSVVKRLVELLGLYNDTITFDCGECDGDHKNIVDNLCDILGLDMDEFDKIKTDPDPFKRRDLVFIFDEFQYARTINDSGEEENNPTMRPVWSILDNGVLEITDRYNWGLNNFNTFIEDFKEVATKYPDIVIKGNEVQNKDDAKKIIDTIGFLQYDSYDPEESEKPLNIISRDHLRFIARRLNSKTIDKGNEIIKHFREDTYTAKELYTELCIIKRQFTREKTLDCHTSLVFVIGNLDEAYYAAKEEINPDIDADIFYDVSSKVSISDIKEALKRRFRAEQIARLGNNLIKYPTLTKDSFYKIIRKEADRIINDFNERINKNLKITVSDYIINLLYSEGVYPTQGVRPVFTTIGTILAPYLSKVIIENDGSDSVLIDIKDHDDYDIKGFKIPSTVISLKFSSGKEVLETQKLQLGYLRNPIERKKRYIASVHEAGHAIIHAYLTGNAPTNIVAVSINRGGFCSTYDKDNEGEIMSRGDIRREIMVSLGGYLAEKLIYKDRDDMTLMGSSSDLEYAWDTISENAYKVGYLYPLSYANRDTEMSTAIPTGYEDKSIIEQIKLLYDGFVVETKAILQNEETLIKHMAKVLGEKGSIGEEDFIRLVREYGNKLTIDHMNKTKKLNDPAYYLETLLK
jgi:cell division protease FtsH